MKKYNLQEGNESLKKILLMMNYDSSKTLSENTSVIIENKINLYEDFIDCLDKATGGVGTDEKMLIGCFNNVDETKFDNFIERAKTEIINEENGLEALLNSELGVGDKKTAEQIRKVFKDNNSTYNFIINRGNFGVRDIKIQKLQKPKEGEDKFKEKFSCFYELEEFVYEGQDNNGYFRISFKGHPHVGVKEDGTTIIWKDGWVTSPEKSRCPGTDETPNESVLRENIDASVINPSFDTSTNKSGGQDAESEQGSKGVENRQDSKAGESSNSSSASQTSNNTNKIFKKGMRGENIKKLKTAISNLVGADVTNILKVNLDSDLYDDKMTAMVAYFQAANDAKVDGIIGPETLSKIQN